MPWFLQVEIKPEIGLGSETRIIALDETFVIEERKTAKIVAQQILKEEKREAEQLGEQLFEPELVWREPL